MKERHGCGCFCHETAAFDLSRKREALQPVLRPWIGQPLLAFVRHLCGPHCIEPDPVTPVRLDWRPLDRYDRSPSRHPCGHVVPRGVAHACALVRGSR